MSIRFENYIDFFLFFIIIIKIIFALSAVSYVIITHSQNYNLKQELGPKLVYWKQRTEFVFIASMSILLIYYFKPGKNRQSIDQETSFLFFLFGLILLFTADWNLFITEAPWYKFLVGLLK